ncbi:MAG TPA: S8 family serine peptidase [Gaiellaceae bacterium]|jgi:subtilisin|nr:S8 family serine peptidase [Gaiellaceae bacterium]
MGRVTFRGTIAALVALTVAPVALAAHGAGSGHSRLVALPSVLPPTPIPRPMRWSAAPSAPLPPSAFGDRRATIGLAAGVDGLRLAAELGVRPVEWLPRLRLLVVRAAPTALSALAGADDARIRYVEPVETGHVAHARNDPLTYTVDPVTGVPYEWQFHAVGADDALNLAKGDPGILVGVVDSGISPVPDLKGKIAETFWDPAVHSSAADALGHGTFVSSIIAARNDDGFGLAGFCGACRLAVFKADPLTDVQVAEGIQKLTDAHVRVINLSIVLDHPAQDVMDAITYATNAGVLVVAASGNDGTGTVDFPASFVQTPNGAATSGIAVGASDEKGARASFSDYGSQLSLVAPGTYDSKCAVGILGAIPASAPSFDDGDSCSVTMTHADGARYAYASGTSFSAPEVAGTAALVWSLKPSLSSAQVAAVLEQSATRPPGTGWNAALGWGVVDARAAVESVAGRSAGDAIALAKLRISRPRGPGSRVEATVDARWADGAVIRMGAKPSCAIAVAGANLHVSTRLAAGILTCDATLPRGSAGKPVIGSISVSASGAATATAAFHFAVTRGGG